MEKYKGRKMMGTYIKLTENRIQKQFIASVIFLLVALHSFSQMIFSSLQHNFGDLQSYDHRFVDITILNKGHKDGYILSVRKPSEVVYIQSRALVQKDSSLTLRFQVNPLEKGKFRYVVDIFTSDQDHAHKLILSGNMEYTDKNTNYLTACPDFNAHPIGRQSNQLDMDITVIDAQTRQIIPTSQVSMIQNGRKTWTKSTNQNGKIKQSGLVGPAYFYVTKNGYVPSEKGFFINHTRSNIVIELTKITQENQQIETDIVLLEIDSTDRMDTQVKITPQLEENKPVVLEDLPPDNFDPAFFAPVNVVFVLDVSSSMNQGDKMELMKYSLNKLADFIREQDRISLVTYASRAQVLLPPTSGADKEAILEQVKKLRAHGMTAGGEGIRMGFEQALKGYLTTGVNHVFVLTDGAFNQKNYDYKKMIKKYTAQKLKLSVVGIVNDQRSEISMREIAQMGQGHYIPIFKLVDAQKNIPQAIRKMAFTH